MERFARLFLGPLLLIGCDEGPTAPTDQFQLDAPAKAEIEAVRAEGKGAEGEYSFADGELSLTIDASGFECGGPSAGESVLATVLELTETQMVWMLMGDRIEWARVDAPTTGIAGVWKTTDPLLYLFLTEDGVATFVGRDECEDSKTKNSAGCVVLGLSGASIQVDGSGADWDAVAPSAVVEDPMGDYSGADSGADLRAMKVEREGGAILVFMQLHAAPSTNFQSRESPVGGVYRLSIEAGQRFSSRVAYNPGASEWRLVDPVDDPGVQMAVGADGIEWSVSLDRFGAAEAVEVIMVEALDCGVMGQSCQPLDAIDECGGISL